MAADDGVRTVLDERGDLLETVVWAGVYLFTLLLFSWEYLWGAFLESMEAGLYPIHVIRQFASSMFLTAFLGGGGVVLLIVVAVLRFGAGVRDAPATLSPGQGTFKFMVFVIAVSALLGMTVFQGAATLAQTDEAGPREAAQQLDVNRELEMGVTAGQWFWRFDVDGIPFTQGDRVLLPANTIIQFRTTSADVIHSFSIKSLGITKDAIPGQVNRAWFYVGHVEGEKTIRLEGAGRVKADTYQVRCAELCGKGHSKMIATIVVVSPDNYQQWAQAQGGTAAIDDSPDNGFDMEGET